MYIHGLLALFAATALAQGNPSSCGENRKYHNEGYNENVENDNKGFFVDVDGAMRTHKVLVPSGYNSDPNRRYPVIFDFHGKGGASSKQFAVSRYPDFDVDGEFIVVYPNGEREEGGKNDRVWQGAPYSIDTARHNDLTYMDRLIDHFDANYCIDTNRIYASGKSNGGGFVNLIACSPVGKRFAAFAMSSAALYSDNLTPEAARCDFSGREFVPIMEAHGREDGQIDFRGGRSHSTVIPDIGAWLDNWAQRNGRTIDATLGEDGKIEEEAAWGDWVRYGFMRGSELVEVVVGFWVDDWGHCWPTETSNRDPCKDGPLEFTPRVLEFFRSWDLRGPRG